MRRPRFHVSVPPGIVVAERFQVERVQHLGGGLVTPVARDRASGDEVTLRVVPLTDPAFDAVHATEVRCLTRLRHPNVARLVGHGACRDNGLRYLALEHVAGLTLERFLALRAPLAPADVRVMGLALAAALAEIHRQGIVLGGMPEPSDILVGWEHGHRRPVITSFARASIGSEPPAGAAPDPRADVRAVGVLLHRMVFGTVPGGQRFGPAGDWSPAVRDVVTRCLADDPDARPRTGGVLARDLARALEA